LVGFRIITKAIGFELIAPELLSRRGQGGEPTAMGMPEAPVDEDRRFEFREDYIG
jgi:hypothetical protein